MLQDESADKEVKDDVQDDGRGDDEGEGVDVGQGGDGDQADQDDGGEKQ